MTHRSLKRLLKCQRESQTNVSDMVMPSREQFTYHVLFACVRKELSSLWCIEVTPRLLHDLNRQANWGGHFVADFKLAWRHLLESYYEYTICSAKADKRSRQMKTRRACGTGITNIVYRYPSHAKLNRLLGNNPLVEYACLKWEGGMTKNLPGRTPSVLRSSQGNHTPLLQSVHRRS